MNNSVHRWEKLVKELEADARRVVAKVTELEAKVESLKAENLTLRISVTVAERIIAELEQEKARMFAELNRQELVIQDLRERLQEQT